MKSSSWLLPLAALSTCASAQSAYLYTIDNGDYPSSTVPIDSEMASSIISRRRGITQKTFLKTTDPEAVYQISSFGGQQSPLFSADVEEARERLFIVYRPVKDEPQEPSAARPNLRVIRPDTSLVANLPSIARQFGGVCEQPLPNIISDESGSMSWFWIYPMDKNNKCPEKDDLTRRILRDLESSGGSEFRQHLLETLIPILEKYQKSSNLDSTLLVVPSKLATPPPQHQLSARAEPEEDPLRGIPFVDSTPTHLKAAASNFTLPAFVPVCFESQSKCENTTHHCSGHGKCYKAHNSCFKCKCGTTVARYNKDGTKKTVQWGGNACQKKDISAPFILFASFGIVMTALVAGAIGMLFSMGSEELPSVIGAGVAGPKAQK